MDPNIDKRYEDEVLLFVRKGVWREALLAPWGDGQLLASSNTPTPTHIHPCHTIPCHNISTHPAAKSPQLLFSSGMECTGPHPNPFSPSKKVGLSLIRARGVNEGFNISASNLKVDSCD